MAGFIDMFNNNRILKFSSNKRSSIHLVDDELYFSDRSIDNGIINRLPAYDGYSPVMRALFPANLLRAELLKAIRYSEISYRKFCTEEYHGLDRKQKRILIGLPLHRKTLIDHTQSANSVQASLLANRST
jgi:hypothetical protein